ncbi:nucleolar protein dao-5 [Aedes albopictus]|uniref:C2H2-type domain-containing protein n=1 Tax=Aedes albopictus TaxID=7160 RepID=A0ABM1ZSU8_AEDAL|nr:nucleolar protein dao-5-like [Aedes albopictus]
MNRLAKLRLRSSSGVGLNASCQSLGNGAGYETANDESITSGCSLYYSVTEEADANGTATNEVVAEGLEDEEQQKKVAAEKEDNSIDATLENDFSVEEVSTIRKPMIVAASPATVKIASKMSCKYLGVSSTPAKVLCRSAGKNLSGIAKLNETDEKQPMPSAMKKMREPKLSEGSSADDGEESKMTLESSVQSVVERGTPAAGHKSFGTNVLAQFFESLDVNKASPVPQIKVSDPDGMVKLATPEKRRESNSLENFFESLKKQPDQEPKEGKENKPISERKKAVRKSLIPKIAEETRPKTRSSLFGVADNRVASPIVKPSRKSSTVRLIPDRLKEMRKANQSDLVKVTRKSVIPPPTKTIVAQVSKVPEPKMSTSSDAGEDIVGDSIKVGPNRNSMVPAPKVGTTTSTTAIKPITSGVALKRKSVMPPVVSRRSVLPAKNPRRSVVSAPSKVALKVPAKTTLTSSDTSRRTTLGKRPTTDSSIDRPEPLAKQRKSLAPVKEAKTDRSPKDTQSRPISRIRPPSIAGSTAPVPFKKPETFNCETCQRPFRLKSSLETHKKLAHQAATPSSDGTPPGATTPDTKCRYCSKSFINGKILSNHMISNCLKIPIPDKRKLLAQDDRERAKSSPSRGTPIANGFLKPPTASGSATSLDTDTSTSSSIGDTSANSSSASTRPAASKTGAIRKPVRTGVGHTGITRTPKKEMKCHLCNRRYLNAVEYALHVQAHAKGMESLDAKTVTTDEATKLVKLGSKQA